MSTPLQMTIKRLRFSRCLLALGLCHTSRTSAKKDSVILQMTSPEMTAHSAFFNPHYLNRGSGEDISPREPQVSRGACRNTLPIWRSQSSLYDTGSLVPVEGLFPGVVGIHLQPIAPLDMLLGKRTDVERCWRLAGTRCPDASSTLTSNYWRQEPQSSRCHLIELVHIQHFWLFVFNLMFSPE